MLIEEWSCPSSGFGNTSWFLSIELQGPDDFPHAKWKSMATGDPVDLNLTLSPSSRKIPVLLAKNSAQPCQIESCWEIMWTRVRPIDDDDNDEVKVQLEMALEPRNAVPMSNSVASYCISSQWMTNSVAFVLMWCLTLPFLFECSMSIDEDSYCGEELLHDFMHLYKIMQQSL